MIARALLLFLGVMLTFGASAQTDRVLCENAIAPEVSSCINACFSCDLNGFSYENKVTMTSNYIFDCRPGVGNFIAFKALTQNLSLEVTLSNCVDRPGSMDFNNDFTDFFLLDFSDGACDSFSFNVSVTPITPCDETDANGEPTNRIREGESKVFSNQRPLEIGRTYFLLLPSVDSVFCTNTIRVLEGSTAVPAELTPVIENTGPVCVGATATYYAAEPLPVTDYLFTVDGDTVIRADSLVRTWTETGNYELCLHANNLCTEPEVDCRIISVTAPDTVVSSTFICPDECTTLPDGAEACTPGVYEVVIPDAAGCPITYQTTVVAAFPDTIRLSAELCLGDSLIYQAVIYRTAGTFETVFANRQGCDSTVILTVTVAPCPVEGSISGTDLRCFGGSDGTLRFFLTTGNAPYTYQFQQLGASTSMSGTVTGQNQPTEFANLNAGTYLVSVQDAFGNEGFFNLLLREPPPLVLTVDAADYGGFQISCAGAADGAISILPSGGTAPYTALWADDAAAGLHRNNLAPGEYNVSVTDSNGCLETLSLSLQAPESLTALFSIDPEICEVPGSGRFVPLAFSGGVGPLAVSIAPLAVAVDTDPIPLSAGDYSLLIEDTNGCALDTGFIIERPQVIDLNLRGDALIELGERADLSVLTSESPEALTWTVSDSLFCQDCPSVSFRPLTNSVVTVATVSTDGCLTLDSLLVRVIPNYAVYMPTAFSPNGDGVNDLFRPLFANTATTLLELSVYDRWGGLVYQLANQPLPLAADAGWSGNVNGENASAGVFTWYTRTRFLDGAVQERSGTVSLLR